MKVSVIICTYNRPTQLKEAFKSYNEQTYPDKELIVVNDGGCPVHNIPADRVVLKENGGVASAINAGLRVATGQVITTLDDDDLFYNKHSLAERVQIFTENPLIDAVYTDSIDNVSGQDRVKIAGNVSLARLLQDEYINTGTMAWRRGVIDTIGYRDETYQSYHDTDFKIKCLLHCNVYYVPKITMIYNRHGGQKSAENSKNGVWDKESKRFSGWVRGYIGGVIK